MENTVCKDLVNDRNKRVEEEMDFYWELFMEQHEQM